MAKKRVKRRVKRLVKGGEKVRATRRKIGIAVKNLILFAVLFLLCFYLYHVSNDPVFVNLFYLFTLLLGFVSLSFLIVLLVLLVLVGMKR